MSNSNSITTKMKKPPNILVTVSSKKAMTTKKGSHTSGSGTQSKYNLSVLNRSMVGSSSRKSVSLHMDSKIMDKSNLLNLKQNIQVYDDQGRDVTPRPLFQPDTSAIQQKQSKMFNTLDTSVVGSSDFPSSLSLYQTSANASFAGPFTRSTFGSSTVSRSSHSTESMTEEIEEPGARSDLGHSISDVQVIREDVREHLTDKLLEKMIDIQLSETETIWLLDLPAVMVSVESEEAEMIKRKNETYIELCKNHAGNDRYTERMTQTFNGAPKTKEVQCEKISMEHAGVMATNWDMYDSYLTKTSEQPADTDVAEKRHRSLSISGSQIEGSRGMEKTMSMSSTGKESRSSSIMDVESIILARIQEKVEQDPDEILKSENFHKHLFFMERVLMENIFQSKLAAYRQLPILTDPDFKPEPLEEGQVNAVEVKSMAPSLDRLWSFTCELTKGHNVSSTAWNKKNSDLLAVGYGQFGFKEQKSGLVCCWSLKNPVWPECIFQCEAGVTSLDFSAANPNLLAVGMYDGIIAVYNVQMKQDIPVLDNSDFASKHAGPVWQVKWIEQDRGVIGEDKGETLISIAADGRITKWYMRKGLDPADLMKLRRTGTEKSKKPAPEKERKIAAFISRQAPGMCFDFNPKDTNIYLAGTEEGLIHKCSCSYNEQFLDTYRNHKGPVHKIMWSPFCHDVFLSCSSDWSISLWRQDLLKPVLNFSSSTKSVHEIIWSPKSATLFGAVNEGRLEIWDLNTSILDPIIVSSSRPDTKLTTVLFTKNTDCVLIGDSDGQVSVFEMRNLPKVTQVSALYDIIGSTLASQL
ncbi:dynein axonemal intermediate chain 4 [Protopterus annectens]|uniref:dynein axonemal intermediate chain 4 n=1 Tax=Protopterus annectens TaxID=7888 RepID=UPI001CF9ACAD|nr:dynein axonemal intermediate chain 4 [Protopterus annectens]